ncbi:meso-butanediol dehydrogenase/(S,S)-butanediol dehydrogenase/diacetyl reductase [Zymomonas mobilis]|uniref:SDR family NAD(P)-dependent oxidoreductase n=1 Tax=Zymomonas mobilis TaxID=542 RepID=UPI000B39702A|nr:SDR family oxidoreductase [Zymomonas mobilis]ART93394.1 3-oxoacyl-ACP reductase [Zymomonas mobilis subsp. mobilis]TWD60087.1 meso-butanediol dehydrogenase/(S,S)-butanediol dehydrogenase/diacetyl reductase [Zymomonas mobilis]
MRFQDKIVVITGGGNGMGKAAAERFSSEGAIVVLADWQIKDAEEVAASLPKDRAWPYKIDVSDSDAVKKMMDDIAAKYGKIDVLVNNAGILIPGKIMDASVEDWKKISSVNIDGVIYCAKFAMPYLIKSKGCIVNTASVSGLGGDWGMVYYCTTKGAVVNFTRALALDSGVNGVRVNSVCPCLVKTKMAANWPESAQAQFKNRVSLGRIPEAEEIASVMAFLASDDARFITGVNLPVDGGATASDGQPHLG